MSRVSECQKGERSTAILKRINKLGYITPSEPHILNACDFGVLQDRKRIIFIGWKKGTTDYPVFESKKPQYTVGTVWESSQT